MSGLLRRRETALALIILALAGLVGLRAPVFLSPRNLIDLLADTAILAMMACAQMLVILTRGIDLSVASILAFSGMAAALIVRAEPDLPLALVVAAAVAAGAGWGLFNGALIALVGAPPIVVTLGAMTIVRGAVFVLAGGKWVNSHEMSAAFLRLPRIELLGLPLLVWIAAALALAAGAFLNLAPTGRALYALGGNPVAARAVGLSEARLRMLVYIASGAVAGLCGALWVARFGIASSEIVNGYELPVIAACVIGGVSIAGGVGTIAGVLLGALFLSLVNNALTLVDVSPFWQMAIAGAAILIAVIVNSRIESRPAKLILRGAR